MKFCTYILISLINNDIYVGSSDDVDRRLLLHNSGKVRSTKPHRPWRVLEKHEFATRSEAVRHERFLKTGQQKEILKKNMAA